MTPAMCGMMCGNGPDNVPGLPEDMHTGSNDRPIHGQVSFCNKSKTSTCSEYTIDQEAVGIVWITAVATETDGVHEK